MTGLKEVDPRAHALTAFRALPDGRGQQYTATTFPKNPWQGCEHMIRMARHVGYVKPSCTKRCDCYAVLDVLEMGGDIVQDFCIPNARAFRWWYRMLKLRVDAGDGEMGWPW